MRVFLGLAGILGVVAVIVWVLGKGGMDYTQAVLKRGQQAQQATKQIAGLDAESGRRAAESVQLEGLTTGGRLSGILVTDVISGGAYERYFGVRQDDTIIAVEFQGARFDVKDQTDVEAAKDLVLETYQKKGSIIVARGGKELTLPQPAPQPQHATPPKKEKSGSPLQDQLDAIQNIPR